MDAAGQTWEGKGLTGGDMGLHFIFDGLVWHKVAPLSGFLSPAVSIMAMYLLPTEFLVFTFFTLAEALWTDQREAHLPLGSHHPTAMLHHGGRRATTPLDRGEMPGL